MEKNTNKRPVIFTGRLFVCQAMLGLIVCGEGLNVSAHR